MNDMHIVERVTRTTQMIDLPRLAWVRRQVAAEFKPAGKTQSQARQDLASVTLRGVASGPPNKMGPS